MSSYQSALIAARQTANIPSSSTLIDSASNAGAADGLVSVLEQVASSVVAGRQETTATNALQVLESAVSADVLSSIESQLASLTDVPVSAAATPTSETTSTSSQVTATSVSSTTSTTATSSLTLTSTSALTSSSTPSTLSTISTRIPSTTVSAASTTTTAAPPTNITPVKGAAIAGIVTGIAAAFVLAALAGAFLWQRKKKGRPLFSRNRGSKNDKGRVYPEVAWLYDPSPSPRRSGSPNHSRATSHSEAALLPRRPEEHEEPEHEMAELGSGSPEMRPARDSSPLLSPPSGRMEHSPSGSPRASLLGPTGGSADMRRSVQSSSSDVRRPLTAVFEESRAQ